MADYSIDDLLYLISRLRDPTSGCPWDLKQTPQSIINYSIEEIYELADAIEQAVNVAADKNAQLIDHSDDIKGELGDVLFQVIFLAQLASEEKQFCFNDVVHSICAKLVGRHPHVFIDGKLYSDADSQSASDVSKDKIEAAQVAKNWEQIKAAERAAKNRGELFDDVPFALPALSRSAKLQKRASQVGFDWPDAWGALEKLKEEVAELEALMTEAQQRNLTGEKTENIVEQTPALQEELGDVLFSSINVARKIGVNGEQALRLANQKFVNRVNAVLEKYKHRQIKQQPDASSLRGSDIKADIIRIDSETLDQLWNEVKRDGL